MSSIQTRNILLIGLAVLVCSPVVTNAASPVVDTIPIAAPLGSEALFGIVASPSQHRVYVADIENGDIVVINTERNQIVSNLATLNPPLGLAISPDGNTLYATDKSNLLEVISIPERQVRYTLPVGGEPAIPAVSPDGTMVFIPNFLDGTVDVLNFADPINAQITIGGGPTDVVFNPDGKEAYVTNGTLQLSVINIETSKVTTITTPTQTVGLAINGNKLYATGVQAVYIINTKTSSVTATVPISKPANANLGIPALTSDGAFLYVPVTESGPSATSSVIIINTQTKKVIGQPIAVGPYPAQVAIAQDNLFAYVPSVLGGTVTVMTVR